MSWVYRDKRTDEPSDAERLDAETDRQRRRLSVREEIAACELMLQKAALLAEEIARIDREAETAADCHQAACGPLQEELQRLEQSAIHRIAARLPADVEADNRRGDIIGEIAEHNRALEVVVDRSKKLAAPLRKAREKLLVESAPLQMLQNKLCSAPLAHPALLLEAFVNQQRIRFLSARVQAAQQGLKIIETNLDGIARNVISGDRFVQEHKANCWRAEIAAAKTEQADAIAAGSAIRQQMIDE
jgi:hypothetical protein